MKRRIFGAVGWDVDPLLAATNAREPDVCFFFVPRARLNVQAHVGLPPDAGVAACLCLYCRLLTGLSGSASLLVGTLVVSLRRLHLTT